MNRLATMSLLCLAVGLATSRPARAEEITLKDGTKIVGHMTGITSDKIEVETSYGKIELNRSEILNINFPENSSGKAPETAAVKRDLPGIDETLSGTQYVNRTGKFSLTLPPEWTIDGKAALLVFYRGALSKSNNLPVEFLSAIITSGNSYTKITAWCVEPLFHDMQPAFEKIVNSYRASGRLIANGSR